MTDVVQAVESTPLPGEAAGWRATSADGLEISYWDGTQYTAHRRWDGTEWQERPDPLAIALAPLHEDFPPSQVAATSWQPPHVEKRKRGKRLLVLAVVVLLAAAAGAGVEYVKRSNSGLAGKSAAQVLAISVAAAKAQGSVHLAAIDSGVASGVSSYDVSATRGTQILSGGRQGNATLLVFPGTAYLKADAAFLHNSLGLSAAASNQYAGRWISFTAGDPGYEQVTSGDTLSSALHEASPTGTLTRTSTQTVDGQQVVGIVGGLPSASPSGATGSVTMYVAAKAPYLPVADVTQGTLNGQHASVTVTFSQWREPVAVIAPSSATPVSSLSPGLASG
jgi:hypothetical protein